MKVLLDTNILIDILCEYDCLSTPASAVIIQAIRNGKLEGSLTTQSIVDASYILSRMPGFSSGKFRNKILQIMNFVNIEDAHKALGRNVGIYYVVDKDNLSAGGYIWRTRKENKPIYYGRNQNYKLRNILQLDKEGNVIGEYDNLKEASLYTGISIPHIVRSIRSINRGYKYKFKLKE